MALDGAAADDLAGLEDVLGGLQRILTRLEVECDLSLPGAWEDCPSRQREGIADRVERFRHAARGERSPRRDARSGKAGQRSGSRRGPARERSSRRITRSNTWNGAMSAEIHFAGGRLRAEKVLFATNGLSLRLSGLEESSTPKLTLATADCAPLRGSNRRDRARAAEAFLHRRFPVSVGTRLQRQLAGAWRRAFWMRAESDDLEDVDIAAPNATQMFAYVRAARARAASRLEKMPFHPPLGRADSLSRGLAARCLPSILRARTESSSAPTPGTAWRCRRFSALGRRKRCSASAACRNGARSRRDASSANSSSGSPKTCSDSYLQEILVGDLWRP